MHVLIWSPDTPNVSVRVASAPDVETALRTHAQLMSGAASRTTSGAVRFLAFPVQAFAQVTVDASGQATFKLTPEAADFVSSGGPGLGSGAPGLPGQGG